MADAFALDSVFTDPFIVSPKAGLFAFIMLRGQRDIVLLRRPAVSDERPFRSFGDFYPYYLSEHSNRISRRLHFVGTSLAVALLMAALATRWWWLVPVALVQGYAFAWGGHFFFEHNKPATFKYPCLSFMADWRLWWEILRGRARF